LRGWAGGLLEQPQSKLVHGTDEGEGAGTSAAGGASGRKKKGKGKGKRSIIASCVWEFFCVCGRNRASSS
jgi:hypothetical protein